MARRASRAVAVWTLLASAAAAAPPDAAPRDPAAAELLFREARKALAAGRTEEACAKFAESQRLDPGPGTLINLAACEEKLGKLASAWEKWQRALESLSVGDHRRPGVEKRAQDLESRVPRLEIRLAAGAPATTKVTRDDIELGPASLGLALPVDPGEHHVQVSAPGRENKTYDVSVAEAQQQTLEVEPGAELPKPAPPPPPAPAPAPVQMEPDDDGPKRLAGFVALGVGAAGVAVGTISGVLALQKKSAMDDDCAEANGRLECGADGMDAAHAGNTYATISTIAFVVGVAGLGAGGWLVLSSGSSRPAAAVTAGAAPNGGFMAVKGTF